MKVQLHGVRSRTKGLARSIELDTDAFEEFNWKSTSVKDVGRDSREGYYGGRRMEGYASTY